MKSYRILISLLILAVATIIIACGTATDPYNEIVTSYKRDYDYLERTFFWLFWPEDSVSKIIDGKIYVFQPKNDFVDPTIIAQDTYISIDPDNYGAFPNEDRLTTVKELTPDSYQIYKEKLYLEMMTYDRNRLIAGWFEVETTSGDTVEIGNIDNDTLQLKLIALQVNEADSTYQTFRNEWRNVYSIAMRDADPQDLQIQIHLGAPGSETSGDKNPDNQDGFKFVTLLGIDRLGERYTPYPDGDADLFDRAIFWPEKGYLFFPNQTPFNPDTTYRNIPLDITVPGIYNTRRSTITSNPEAYTEYYFVFIYLQ